MDTEIDNLKKRVAQLETRVTFLESQLDITSSQRSETQAKLTVEEEYFTDEEVDELLDAPKYEPVYQEKDKPKAQQTNSQFKSLEGKLGRNLMSIVASVLIFVSIVLFGSMIESMITPLVKTIIIYICTIAVGTFGFIKMRKEGSLKLLFTAIAACGMGAFYVANLVSYFILETMNDSVMMVMSGIWICASIVLARNRHAIFNIICYAGIIISTILACINWHTTLVPMILYFICTTVIYALNKKDDYSKDLWYFVQ